MLNLHSVTLLGEKDKDKDGNMGKKSISKRLSGLAILNVYDNMFQCRIRCGGTIIAAKWWNTVNSDKQ
jgi:hypothetical protein